jgi:molecular chaperone DnaK
MTQRPVLGIDLGTTYSCVAHVDRYGKAAILPNADGDNTTPSVVYIEESGNVVVGKDAKNELRLHPDRVFQLIKRKMGVPGFVLELDGRRYNPAQISAMILKSVMRDALVALGAEQRPAGPAADVVITVPAYFGEAERAATREAGKLAGFNVIGIINEPTAAAVAYGLARDTTANTVLVYDLGGGTFDVTVVETSTTVIRAIATGGNRELGGADWDAVLCGLVLAQYREQHPDAREPSTDEEAMGALDVLVEDIKKRLTRSERYTGSFTAGTSRASIEISRDVFEEHTRDLVERTMQYTDLVLNAAAKKGVRRLDDVILVGGMSRVPMIARVLRERLRERFADAPVPHLVDPDQIVAKGAAMYAAASVGEQYGEDGSDTALAGPVPPLVNVASRGYGIEAVNGISERVAHVSWLIQPNDELPAAPQQLYATVANGQTEVEIVVYESGTVELNDEVAVNTELVRGLLTGLPPHQPPGQRVTVTFCLTDEGILEILATGPTGQKLNLRWQRPGGEPTDVPPA